MKKKILIPYATYGSGHKAIAQYIENYFKKQSDDYEILTIDLLSYSSPIAGMLTKKISENLMIKHPHIWRVVYNMFDTRISGAISDKVSMGMFKNSVLKKLVTDFNPDLTISTHFYGSSLIASYKKKGLVKSKLITVVTDYEAHELWVKSHKADDYLVVCSEDEKKALVKRGIEKNKIKTFGIPIDPVLLKQEDFPKSRKKYGLDGNKLSCLFFGGGGNGSRAIYPYIKKVIKMNLNINFLFVSGKNTRVKNKVTSWVKRYNAKNIQVFGFVTNAPELYQIVDFVITKPGGAQSTECLYFKKPAVLITSSGGQEDANHRFFTKNGYGRRFKTVYSFARFLRELEENDTLLDEMRNNILNNKSEKAMEELYKIAKGLL